MEPQTITIDAAGKSIGRVASEVATVLMGKNRTDFVRHAIPKARITVLNASRLHIRDRKKKGKVYERYSGYPGGLKTETLGQRIARKGNADILKNAIQGMLPKNKLRSDMLRHLTIIN